MKIMAALEMTSGSISLIASVLMVCCILRSRKKLSTTLQRLLMALCISDIVSSLVISLSSILSPAETDIWLASGTFATCSVQGFFKTFGIIATPMYNCAICINYMLIIKYNMSDEYIKKRAEPFFIVVPFIWASALGANMWITKSFNPHYASCFIIDYPFNCSNDPDINCLRGEEAWSSPFYRITSLVSLLVVPVTIFTSLVLIHRAVLRQEQRSNRFGRGSLNLHTASVISTASPHTTSTRPSSYLSRQSLTQLVAYSVAWLVPNMWVVSILYYRLAHGRDPPISLRMCFHFFNPIQGLFNLIAFIVPRLVRTRKLNPEYSIKEALWKVLNLRQSIDEEENVTRTRRGSAVRRRSSLLQPSLLTPPRGLYAVDETTHVTPANLLENKSPDTPRTFIHSMQDFCGNVSSSSTGKEESSGLNERNEKRQEHLQKSTIFQELCFNNENLELVDDNEDEKIPRRSDSK